MTNGHNHKQPAHIASQKPTQTMRPTSPHQHHLIQQQQQHQSRVAGKPMSAQASSPANGGSPANNNNNNNMFGKATNVIERRGEHNKNLDEPFLPRAVKPKVFVSEPKVFVPSSVPRTAASIMQEFKNRPVRAPQPSALQSHLDMIEAASALQMTDRPNHHASSARIQNFDMYADLIKRRQLQVSQKHSYFNLISFCLFVNCLLNNRIKSTRICWTTRTIRKKSSSTSFRKWAAMWCRKARR